MRVEHRGLRGSRGDRDASAVRRDVEGELADAIAIEERPRPAAREIEPVETEAIVEEVAVAVEAVPRVLHDAGRIRSALAIASVLGGLGPLLAERPKGEGDAAPSGDHCSSRSVPSGRSVTRRASPPARSRIAICGRPSFGSPPRMKAMRPPSGDHRPWRSCPPAVSGCASLAPFASTIHRSRSVRLPSMRLRVKRIREPSGAICGSETPTSSSRSSGATGRRRVERRVTRLDATRGEVGIARM